MPTSRQEAQWVLQAQCRDREALELLLRSVQPWLHRYLTGLVGSLHADDVMQDVLILLCRNLAALQTPELFRAVLALHFQQQLSRAEVAAILGIPLGTVKSRLAAGLAALRNHFGVKRSR